MPRLKVKLKEKPKWENVMEHFKHEGKLEKIDLVQIIISAKKIIGIIKSGRTKYIDIKRSYYYSWRYPWSILRSTQDIGLMWRSLLNAISFSWRHC